MDGAGFGIFTYYKQINMDKQNQFTERLDAACLCMYDLLFALPLINELNIIFTHDRWHFERAARK